MRITPDASNNACTLGSGTSTEVCCRPATIEPRPLLTATIGLCRANRRAIRANLRGLPKLSRYSRAMSVAGSVSQYCNRSLPETSARLPADTKLDTPSPRRAASPSTAAPNAPDWQKKPARPASGVTVASEAFSEIAGSVFSTPRQFGPTTRMPLARAWPTSSPLRGQAGSPGRLVAGFAEPGGDHHQGMHAARAALLDQVEHLGGRNHQYRQVDLARDLGQAGDRPGWN